MKRVVIFAHFDKHNIIDPYVISYLKELKKYSDIVFVSDCDLEKKEIKKIDNICFDNICKKHGEYDFGSYKKGFKLLQTQYIEKFNQLDEILFVNDSCYLIGSFNKVFTDMEQKLEVDFWGLTDNYTNLNNIRYHIQSYFLAFRKEVFLDKRFQDFINNIEKQNNKSIIIDFYEIGLSEFLIKNNKKSFAIFGHNETAKFLADNMIELANEIFNLVEQNSYLSKKRSYKINKKIFNIYVGDNGFSNKSYFLIKNKIPVLKRLILNHNYLPKEKLLFLWEEMIKSDNKDLSLELKRHFERLKLKIKNKKTISSIFRYFSYRLLATKFFYIKYYNNGQKLIKILCFKFKM